MKLTQGGAVMLLTVLFTVACSGDNTAMHRQELDRALSKVHECTRDYIREDDESIEGTALECIREGVEEARISCTDSDKFATICRRFEVIVDGTFGDILEYLPDLRQDLAAIK